MGRGAKERASDSLESSRVCRAVGGGLDWSGGAKEGQGSRHLETVVWVSQGILYTAADYEPNRRQLRYTAAEYDGDWHRQILYTATEYDGNRQLRPELRDALVAEKPDGRRKTRQFSKRINGLVII